MPVFTVAERVTILYETGIYEVLALGSEYLLLKDEFGFERKVAISLICKTKQIEVKKLVQKDLETTSMKVSYLQEMPHLDLHSEALEERGVVVKSDEVVLLVQLREFKNFCNQMIDQRQLRFRIIHGIGNGVLRNEIRALLANRKGFTLHDDQVSFGRVGASLVELRLSEAKKF